MPSATHVSLFIPCLVDQVCPEMGLAMVRVLERLGVTVSYDPEQTCCGQPAFNAGHHEEARKVARHFVEVFGDCETVVSPSGSCTAMVRNFYPVLFKGTPDEERATQLGPRVYEFSEYLGQTGLGERISGWHEAAIGFHNSCHSYRELGVDGEPFALLERIEGLDVRQPDGEPVCCGFGGLFSVKFAEVAAAMALTRLEMFTKLDVDAIVGNDPGCIVHMRQEAAARKIDLPIIHLAELLDTAMSATD